MQRQDKAAPASDKRFTLRMDGDLFKKISDSAKRNRRSVAKEIEHIVDLQLSGLQEQETSKSG